MPAIDEQQRKWDLPDPTDERRVADQGHHGALESCTLDGATKDRQGVHLADLGVDKIWLVVLPPGLVFLAASVVVEANRTRP